MPAAASSLPALCRPTAGGRNPAGVGSGRGVGTLVSQIGKIAGCRVVGIAGGDAKCASLVDEVGVDKAVDYKSSDSPTQLAASHPDGFEPFFDNTGGPRAGSRSRCAARSRTHRLPRQHVSIRFGHIGHRPERTAAHTDSEKPNDDRLRPDDLSEQTARGRGGSLAVIAHGKDETIMPGEVIGSGGNGCDLERGAWLNDGDCVELNVHGIGTLWNTVRAALP
jgi:hypothetical protein